MLKNVYSVLHNWSIGQLCSIDISTVHWLALCCKPPTDLLFTISSAKLRVTLDNNIDFFSKFGKGFTPRPLRLCLVPTHEIYEPKSLRA